MLVGKSKRRLFNQKALSSLAFILAGFFLLSILFSATVSPVLAQTDLGLNEAAQIGLGSSDPRVIIVRIIQVALGFLALVAVVIIMYAGWTMMSSEGNAEKVEQAKNILKNAVIGLVIIFSAFAIVSFILNALTGSFTGDDGDDDDGDNGPGIEALGNGIIKSVYPAPGQKDVVRNTSIIVTFREEVKSSTICKSPVCQNNGENCDEGESGCVCKCNGGDFLESNFRIYKTEEDKQEDADGTTSLCGVNYNPLKYPKGCTTLKSAKVYTSDNETFVFVPDGFLDGSYDEIDYSGYITNNIKKAGDKDAGIFDALGDKDYGWSFSVGDVIDLTPPQVKNGGVFPAPDNERDTSSEVAGAKAAGSIEVKNRPGVYTASKANEPVKEPPSGNWPDVLVSGTYNCFNDGEISVTVGSDGNLTVMVSSLDVKGLVSGDSAGDGVIFIGCGLSLAPVSGNFSAGNKWKLAVTAEKQADTLKVGSREYVFVSGAGGGDKIQIGDKTKTAVNIVAALAGHPEVAAGIKPSANTVVELAAKNAGADGNNIELATSNPEALKIGKMRGGQDREVTAIKKDRLDKARNAVIQINFNEAINPLTVSGEADLLKDYIKIVNAKTDAQGNPAAIARNGQCSSDADCLSFKCRVDDKAATDAGCAEGGACVCKGDNDYLEGKFIVSNQYNTAEFVTNNQCGINACGEPIYCLPENSHLKAVLIAAELTDCGEDNCAKKSPFDVCDSDICKNREGKKYPLSKLPLEGIADMALNSLDGNRNSSLPPAVGSADGPKEQSGQSAYDENHDSPGSLHGDDFIWSFFINDKIDLTPPVISATRPKHDGSADKRKEIEIEFSEFMMSGSLATGEKIIKTVKGDEIIHKLINLRSYTNEQPGYWVSKTDVDDLPPADGVIPAGDGEPDRTKALLNHSVFSEAAKYRAQVGSGVKDIYQNCFMPCDGPACSGENKQAPSCCGGTLTDKELCE
ncbi:MAG: hypothetical protein WCW25_02040 [Patescibacteria group bacterium]